MVERHHREVQAVLGKGGVLEHPLGSPTDSPEERVFAIAACRGLPGFTRWDSSQSLLGSPTDSREKRTK